MNKINNMNEKKDLNVKEVFALALENQHRKNFDVAQDLYNQVLKINPNNVNALNNIGLLFQNKRDYKKANNYFEKPIEIDPNFIKAHNNLGVTFKLLGENEKAKSCYEKTLEIDPNNSIAINNLGNAFKELGEHQNAISCYEKAIKINPNYIDAYINLGTIFLELEEIKKSINYFEKAIEIDPNFIKAQNNLGLAFFELGEIEKAKSCYEKALEIDPNNSIALNNLGNAFKELGEHQNAISCYEKAIKINPNYAGGLSNLGILYGNIGNQIKSVNYQQESLINRSEINFKNDEINEQKLRPATSSFFLELTNKCNFHCEFCPSDSQTRLHGYMELSLVKKIFDEISKKKIVTTVNLHLMGEPTLHPKLNEILMYAKNKNVKVTLTTNGSTLVKKRVPKLLDSISGSIVASLMTPTKETYKIRGDVGLSWDRYVDNFRLLIQEHLKKILRGDKIEYEIIFRVMVTNERQKGAAKVLESSKGLLENYEEWSNFTETIEKELGIIPFDRKKIDPNQVFSLLENDVPEVAFYLQRKIKIQFWRAFTFANTRVKDEYKLEPQEKTQFCPHPFTDFGVLWNGDVSLCCLDYDATLKVGNVKNHSVEDVLKSADSNKLRASMYGLEKLHPTCVKCQSRPVEK